MQKRLFIKTYGCQMNERDSEQVAQMLMERGHTITVKEDEADVVWAFDMMKKLGVNNVAGLTQLALSTGLTHLTQGNPSHKTQSLAAHKL